jgi:hypothetical protein
VDADAVIARLEAVVADEGAAPTAVVRAAELLTRLRGWGAKKAAEPTSADIVEVEVDDDFDELAQIRKKRATGVR